MVAGVLPAPWPSTPRQCETFDAEFHTLVRRGNKEGKVDGCLQSLPEQETIEQRKREAAAKRASEAPAEVLEQPAMDGAP